MAKAGFTKTFCSSLDILTDEAGILRRSFPLFVGHFNSKRDFDVNRVQGVFKH